jgi:hypothetical protein
VSGARKKPSERRLTAQEVRLGRHLDGLAKCAEKLRAIDRLGAQLLSSIVSAAVRRVDNTLGEPFYSDRLPTTVSDMKSAIAALSGPGGWVDDVPDDADPTARRREKRPARAPGPKNVIHFASARQRILARRRTEQRREP